MAAENLLMPESLHRALEGSLSQDQALRKESEDYLFKISTAKGAIPLLLSLISADAVEAPVRLAGAVKLKNLVLSYWRDANALCDEDRAALWKGIYDAILSVGRDNDLIRRQCFEALRHIVFSAEQADVSYIVQRVKNDLEQRSNGDTLLCALKALRKLMYRYEYHSHSMLNEVNAMIDGFFGHLLQVAQDASNAGLESPEAAECIHQVLKVYFSLALLTSPTTNLVKSTLQSWMALVQFVLDNPVRWDAVFKTGEHAMMPYVELPDDEESRLHEMPRFKCLKWALQILTKYMSRQAPKKIDKELGKEHFVRYLKDGYAVAFAKKIMVLLQAESSGGAVFTNSLHHRMWTYLKYTLPLTDVYNASLQPCAAVIVQMLFQTFACNTNDEQQYLEDPESYIQNSPDVSFQLMSPRGTAADFIKDACKFRRAEFAPIIISAARDVFRDRGNSVPELYGVMCLVGHSAAGVLQNSKKSKKKQASTVAGIPEEQLLDGEAFITTFVAPLLSSPDKWLRMRAAWLCGHVVRTNQTWRDSQTLLKLYSKLVELLGDQEVIVSVMATGAVLAFFHASDETLQKTIVEYLPHLLQNLFKLMERVELESVVSTLDEIVEMYSVAVLPFGAQITENVCNALWNSIGSEGAADKHGEDTANDEQILARWSMVQTLTSIVRLASEADTKAMTPNDCDMFAKIAHRTTTLLISLYEHLDLDSLMDYIDDLAMLLSYVVKITHKVVSFVGEEKAAAMGARFADMWKILGLCMKAIGGYHAAGAEEDGEMSAVMVEISVIRGPVRSLLAYAPSGFTFECAMQLYTLCQGAISGDDGHHAERLLADVFEVSINNRACDGILAVAAKELTKSVVDNYDAIINSPPYFQSKVRYAAVLLTYSCRENPPLKSLDDPDTLIRVIIHASPGCPSKYMRKLFMVCLSSLKQVGVHYSKGESIQEAINELLLDASGATNDGGMDSEVDDMDDEDDSDLYSDESDDDDYDYDSDDEDYDDSYDDEDFEDGCSPLDSCSMADMCTRLTAGKPAL
ncbi:importin-beta N-terminal domain-containing protein [Babesia ovata]|uniref:Importin-beta N-terminal domain-containing protein n=1 Tax=Babesia ovata TaxID=189622 RepID=A0A2H6K8K0_9APIC|nr:importin-beta N-terminal domain-containing protein [Babesia ovata]GBE59279.1 importin-beta N-terminal domain-containing protein [Babesia ovata]